MAHERLRQPDVVDQLGDGGRRARQALDDPEPVDVRERLVEDPQRAEVVGTVDEGSDRAADPGGRRDGSNLLVAGRGRWPDRAARLGYMREAAT